MPGRFRLSGKSDFRKARLPEGRDYRKDEIIGKVRLSEERDCRKSEIVGRARLSEKQDYRKGKITMEKSSSFLYNKLQNIISYRKSKQREDQNNGKMDRVKGSGKLPEARQ